MKKHLRYIFSLIFILLLFFMKEARAQDKIFNIRDPFKPLITSPEISEKISEISGANTIPRFVTKRAPGLWLAGILKFKGGLVAIFEEGEEVYIVRAGDLVKKEFIVNDIDFYGQFVILQKKGKGSIEKIKMGGE